LIIGASLFPFNKSSVGAIFPAKDSRSKSSDNSSDNESEESLEPNYRVSISLKSSAEHLLTTNGLFKNLDNSWYVFILIIFGE
jgi:hypothetical protein